MSQRFFRFFAIFMIAIATITMISLPTDAEARRFGGARSFGSQSSNIFKQRQAVKPPAANTTQRAANTNSTASRSNAAASNTARSGMSRFIGPIAGIAAGLGLAALLSAFGLSGAFLEFMSSLLLIGIVIFGIMFIVRRLRGAAPKVATQSANHNSTNAATAAPIYRQSHEPNTSSPNTAPNADQTAAHAFGASNTDVVDESWFIPENFDTTGFLNNAKQQFIKVQSLWDAGDINQLRELLTDDLIAEVSADLQNRNGENVTEVVLLNAELMGIEKVSGGHLASVRYSGMLRELPNPQAEHFEEVWNLYKTDNSGWMIAGIQQINANN